MSSPAARERCHDEEEDEEVAFVARRRAPMRRVAAVAAVLATFVGLSVCLVLCSMVLRKLAVASPSARGVSSTARALLASEELRDLTTDNLMALHGPSLAATGRSSVRDRVSLGFDRIQRQLEQSHPDAAEQLDRLEVSGEQQEAALRSLRKFGDARMVLMSRSVAEAVEDNARDEGGDSAALQRRLSDALAPRLADLFHMHAEMSTDVPVDPTSALGKWHPQLEVDMSATRRLSVLDGITGGVSAHAQALFESLERQLGGKMPKAPARMLSFESSYGGSGMGAGSGDDGTAKFMDCIKAAVPDPTKVCKCIADNLEKVVQMVMAYVKSKTGA
eukprot:CAMPEP_0176067068 /NCGR_PEP_ID=MMETSP0120_2-20121206/33473_1 /TAXON_ID=160619 /ORGANISM="Kryptoperidinium foliaceum, Strain CCMP 1326" /LENGTH=332 /DNA_ID=CAMNT_0017400679 /DNA_START=1 /DNA_END=999 /DNA_ORIENTATION=+